MKFRNLRNIFLLSTVLLLGFSLQAYAQTSIAVVDIDLVLSKSKAAQSVKTQVEEKRKKFLASVKKEEDKLREEQKAIEAKRSEMSKEDLIKKAQEFDKRRLEARTSIQKKKTTLDKSYTSAMNTLTKVIFEVCESIANEQKIDLIITKQNIIVGNKSLDITANVMDRMNKKLPKLTLE